MWSLSQKSGGTGSKERKKDLLRGMMCYQPNTHVQATA